MTKMPETTMPQVRRGDSGEAMCGGRTERVELAGAIAPSDHVPSAEILQRKTKRVKFYGAGVISGKLTDRDKILDEARCDKNIIKNERTTGGGKQK